MVSAPAHPPVTRGSSTVATSFPHPFGRTIAAVLGTLGLVVSTSPSAGATEPATVTVLHAIPTGMGADLVDVYSGRTLLVDDLAPGDMKTLDLPGRTYDIAIFADGARPGSSTALLRAPRARVTSGSNVTFAAALTAAGRPILRQFTNNTRTVGMAMGRLTVRHIAAAPAVDVRSGESVLMRDLRNPGQRDAGLYDGTYRLDVVLAGTSKRAEGPFDVIITNKPGRSDMGNNAIVYIWGSAADGSLQHTIQNVRLDLQ